MLLTSIFNFFFLISSCVLQIEKKEFQKGDIVGSIYIEHYNFQHSVVYGFYQELLDQDLIGVQERGLMRNNLVFAGHNKKGVFSVLEKLAIDDIILIQLYGKESFYQVTERKVVDETEIQVLEETSVKQVTLLTCLWNPKLRLVIIAKKRE